MIRAVIRPLMTRGRAMSAATLAIALGGSLMPDAALAQRGLNIRQAVASDVSVRLNGDFAQLRIIGWRTDSLVVSGALPKGARFDGGVAAATPKQAPRGAKFYVEHDAATPTAALELYVPAGARVWAKAANATIEVRGVTGGLDLNIVGGAIVVNGDPAELNVEAMDGSVEILGSPKWMRVKTASGDIRMRGTSEDAAFTTVSGNVQVREGTFERVRLETVTGSASFGGQLAPGGSLNADSHSGVIELLLGKTSNIDVDAIAIAGSIENLASKARPVAGRQGRGQELGAGFGDGSARATLRTFKGTIRLRLG